MADNFQACDPHINNKNLSTYGKALDAGDCGLGCLATSLELGCDCLGTIKYFDAVLNNHAGEPVIKKNAICLHEEDAGMKI